MTDFLIQTNIVLAYAAAICTGIVALGFVRLITASVPLVRHMALGLILMHIAVLTRTLYWDVLRRIVGTDAWGGWFGLAERSSINIVFNVMIVLASYHALRALKLSIPEDIRARYSLVGSAFYPRLGFIGRRSQH